MTEAQGQPTPEATADTQVEAQPEAERTFTQADLKKIAANEKREGKQSAISELLEKTGAESIDDVLSAYSEYQGIQEAVTTEADRVNTRAEKMEAKAKQAEERYTNTLRDFALRDALRDAGVQSESLGFVMRGIDKSTLSVDSKGNVSGVEEAVSAAQEEAPMLFGSQERQRVNAPQTNGTGVQKPASSGSDPETIHANFLANLLGGA